MEPDEQIKEEDREWWEQKEKQEKAEMEEKKRKFEEKVGYKRDKYDEEHYASDGEEAQLSHLEDSEDIVKIEKPKKFEDFELPPGDNFEE